MAVNITMPKWGLTMKSGKITKWFKQEGETVKKGEPFFEVETEKITNLVEAVANGVLFQIVVPVGTTVPVGTVVAIVAQAGEKPERMEGVQQGKATGAAPAAAKAKAAEAAPQEKKFVPASPAARRLAKEMEMDLTLVPGTGPEGRITEADVKKYHEDVERAHKPQGQEGEKAGESDGAVRSIPFTGMRRAIAANMHASLHNAAQLTIFAEVDVTEMVRYLDLVREEYKKGEAVRVSYNDIIIMAAARALKLFPMMNSNLAGEEILIFDDVNMGIAVALPEGLIVPVLRQANKKGLLTIAKEARSLAQKARQGNLGVDEVTGGTFTITNVSMFQVDGFTPILKPPETGILGVGRIKEKPAVHEGQIAIRSMMFLSLTFDHQVVDGGPANEFLQTVGRYLEQPLLMMS